MPKPLDIAGRLNALLEYESEINVEGSEFTKATHVDMKSLQDQRNALNTCVGPTIGWEAYSNGKNYKPPHLVNEVDHAYGPPDGNAWKENKESGDPERVKKNPYSNLYGGVRPWSVAEIVAVMTDERRTSGMFPFGIVSIINRFKSHAEASRPGVEFDPRDFLGQATNSLMGAIAKDKGKHDTEFTKYLALHMDLSGGAAAGLHNEHRTSRGILTKLSKLIFRISNAVESEDYDAQSLIDTIGALGSKDIKMRDADPSIEHIHNKFGRYAKRMQDLYKNLRDMIVSGDAEGIRSLKQEVQYFYDQVESDEEQFSDEGMAHGTLGSQPKDMAAIGTKQHRWEASTWDIMAGDPDLDKMDPKKISNPSVLHKKHMVIKRDEMGRPLMRPMGTVKAKSKLRALSAAKELYAEKYNVPLKLARFLPFTAKENIGSTTGGYGSVTGSTTNGGEDGEGETDTFSTIQQAAQDDPEFKEELSGILHSLRYGSSKQLAGQARRSLDIVDNLFSVIEHATSSKPRHKFEVRPDNRKIGDQNRLSTRSGGFNIIDTGRSSRGSFGADMNQIVSRADTEREAYEIVDRMNNPLKSTIQHIGAMLTKPKVGDNYYDDLYDIARDVVLAIKLKDIASLQDIIPELEVTKGMIEDDLKSDPSQHEPMLNDREYRIALRKLGIGDYPEKGTINDPEIDEHGNLSQWAQAGYPGVQKDTGSGQGALSGTLFHPGQEEGGEVMLDKHISKDIGVSAQSVGNIWRKVLERISPMVEQLYEHHVWTGDLDSIDLQVLRETCNRVAILRIEEMRRISHYQVLYE